MLESIWLLDAQQLLLDLLLLGGRGVGFDLQQDVAGADLGAAEQVAVARRRSGGSSASVALALTYSDQRIRFSSSLRMSSMATVVLEQGRGQVLAVGLELLLQPRQLLVDLAGRDGDLLPVQEDGQELGVDQRVDGVAIHLLAVLVGRDGVAAQEVDDLALGDLVGDVVIGDRGHDIVGAGDHRCAARRYPCGGARGRAGCSLGANRAGPCMQPQEPILTTVRPGLSCASNRSPSRGIGPVSITPEVHGRAATRSATS